MHKNGLNSCRLGLVAEIAHAVQRVMNHQTGRTLQDAIPPVYMAKLISARTSHKREFTSMQEKKPIKEDEKKKPNKDWIAWTLFCLFIVGSIVFMLVIDSIYAPSEKHSATQSQAIEE
jgi:uncharacterized membrane protein